MSGESTAVAVEAKRTRRLILVPGRYAFREVLRSTYASATGMSCEIGASDPAITSSAPYGPGSPRIVRYWPKADLNQVPKDVCFRGQDGHDADKPPLRLRGPPWVLFAGLAKTAARKALRSGKGIIKVA